MELQTHYDALLERLAAVTPAANRVSRGDLYDLVRAIEVLAIERPNPDQLWTLRRVATHLGLDQVQTERLLTAPGGPQPLTGDRVQVWRAKDIYRWLDRGGRATLTEVKK
jgi:hypothetical protein